MIWLACDTEIYFPACGDDEKLSLQNLFCKGNKTLLSKRVWTWLCVFGIGNHMRDSGIF